MANIGWNESSPPDTESAGLGDDRIRSLTTSIRIGLDAEHVWPSGGGDAGVHRPGSARAYFGSQSQISSAGTDGRLMQALDAGRFFHVGSLGTSFIGGQQVLSIGQFPGATPQRHIWVEEMGVARVLNGAFTSVSVSYNGSSYSGIPYVFVSQNDLSPSAGVQYSTSAIDITSAAFTISLDRTAASDVSVAWRSIGTRVL